MQIQTQPKTQQPATCEAFLEIDNVSKVYPTAKGLYPVLENVNLTVSEGEFICIIGHSGCGKSTLLNMVAGFLKPSEGEVRLRNQRIAKPGPDRMMVFQNYCLLPWKTAFENVYLAVKSVYPQKSHAERVAITEEHLAMVGLIQDAHKRPGQMSGGMKQRVAIARALAIRPQVLILDEPFGALDAITKEELQEQLLQIWQDHRCTVLMITHDIDEALFLADKVVIMTNGPSAKIGEVLDIPFPRPRVRTRVMEDPRYYELRNRALDFLFRRFAHTEDMTAIEEVNYMTAKAGVPRDALITLAATVSIFLLGGVFHALADLSGAYKTSPKVAETPAATANVSQSATSLPSESAGSVVETTTTASATSATATPTPTAETTASPSVVSSPAESSASEPSVATSTAATITEPVKLEELNKTLSEKIKQNWQQKTPTFTEELIYIVKVNSAGAIIRYEFGNEAASEYVKDTPLPDLVDSASSTAAADAKESLANFKVVFTPTGEVQVTPASQ
ncbi:MAG: nitrate ABC transporter ATP-binding protein [Oscillatoriaceae bacterium SKW80]|nr:nitrate ABC transporter ATP-binding protein [Oscillatoriaceae bacterium SKYG93]MCX8119464.1 nitrate ABC transporter ATP-binding protein [Oscillatoriaceae bacterium SKW80]MDW8454930.1 nitrate ABC transporter ATP-binding protein [Oscillatoriaceae cyanobacterium SKYGB_i_bin93]HIK28291.1 ATP-binding cassette domain-containing protein [Oscillatoriaceae cyanobacterium M7585_C2015_266]